MPLSLEEIATGVERTIKIRRWASCDTCSGSGAATGSGVATCTACNGSGEVRQVSRSMFGQFINVAPCANCGGSGQVIKEPCVPCRGEGRIESEATVSVTIPAGVRTGNYLEVPRQGHAGRRGGSTGNVIVVVEEQEHESFERNEDDVYVDVTVNVATAALGGEIEVPTLFGPHLLTIDSGSQPGTMLRMKGKGIPHLNARGAGDQYVRFNVWIPTTLSAKEKSTLRELASSKHFEPDASGQKRSLFERFKDVFS
jgi:molecular chaperone DnaJ